MERPPAQSYEELEELRELVKVGKLFQVQEWMQAGKPIYCSAKSKKRSVLEIAARSGFYSMVELLAKEHPDRDTLNSALTGALKERHPEIAMLLVQQGADVDHPCIEDIVECYDPRLMRFVLGRIDISKDDALARAIRERARPLVGVFKEYGRKPGGDAQLAKALQYFVEEKDDHWVSLTLWMGADPRLRVTSMRRSCDRSGDEEDDSKMSALEVAYLFAEPRIVKQFKLDLSVDDPNSLMARMFFPNAEVIEHLLAKGAKINDKPGGGSLLIDRYLSNIASDRQHGFGSERYISDDDVRMLIARGARFAPENTEEYKAARSAILGRSIFGKDLLKLLAYAAEPAVIRKLLDTPNMRQAFGGKPDDVMKRLRINFGETEQRSNTSSQRGGNRSRS